MKLECFRNAARSFAKNRGSLGLAIVMLFAGIAANSVMAGPAQDTNTAQSGSAKFERSFALAAGGTIAVENRKGTIRVTGSDGNKVTIRVEKRISGGTEKQREEWIATTKVNFANEANRVTVRVEYPDINCTFCANTEDEVDLIIAAPREVNLELSSTKSAIEVKGTSGRVRVDTEKGSVRLEGVTANGLRVSSQNTDTIIATKSITGDVDVETEKGSIVLRVPSTVGLNLDYHGGAKAIFSCDFPVTINGEGTELRNVSGRAGRNRTHITGKVNQGGPQVILRTSKGSVSIENAP